jgi:hypothetical protein
MLQAFHLEREIRPSMRSKVWYAPDLRRYTVTVLDEPFDTHRTLAFQRHDDGWIGAVTIGSGDLREMGGVARSRWWRRRTG